MSVLPAPKSVTEPRALEPGGAGTARRAPSVVLHGVSKLYGGHTALDQVTLEVAAGTFVVLLGPSGSGKTTLVRCVAGIERVSSGRIEINGAVVADRDVHLPPERRDLGMVFQDYALWPHLTAQQNVEFALRRRHMPRSETAVQSSRMLARVGLSHLAGRYPNELSGGEQQRVAVARALVANTGLLLFDEPLSNLDANLREQLRVEIATLAREAEATSVYITHDQAEAFALGDAIGVLEHGRLVQLGTPESIYHHPANPFVARFTGLAGELPATAGEPTRSGPGSMRVFLDSVSGRPSVETTTLAPCPPGTQGTFLVRPSAVRLRSPGDDGSAVRGRVHDVAFRGRGYDHAIECGGGGLLVGVHDERRWERGEHVEIAFAGAGCFFA